MRHADIGLIGLAVMGENLALNIASRGYQVAVFNRTVSKVDEFITQRGVGSSVSGAHSLEEFIDLLARPRKIILMVKAGQPVDDLLHLLAPRLSPGDIIIDGGNSYFADTQRRCLELEKRGLLYIGSGISGGEEGALRGPSIMPGGSAAAWSDVAPILQAIAARAPDDSPCCSWMGSDGAGHFVKMVHNGIEYGDMQLISEAYWILRNALHLSADDLAEIFADWNNGPLQSYLIEITSKILRKKDQETHQPLVDLILDCAGQKGTGKWTSATALDLGICVSTIAEAVFARCLSAVKEERVRAAELLPGPRATLSATDSAGLTAAVRDALYASKICSYAQGFALLRAASHEFNWQLDLGQIALVWRNGCIIRARFLEPIRDAFAAEPDLPNLLLAPFFREAISEAIASWRSVLSIAIRLGIPAPAFSSALAYYDSYRSAHLPANLIQAQRDFFGAHTFMRTDLPGVFHADWSVPAQ